MTSISPHQIGDGESGIDKNNPISICYVSSAKLNPVSCSWYPSDRGPRESLDSAGKDDYTSLISNLFQISNGAYDSHTTCIQGRKKYYIVKALQNHVTTQDHSILSTVSYSVLSSNRWVSCAIWLKNNTYPTC